MLSSLSIINYAIIKQLTIDFSSGFCVITGETGAGKSIIMGALSLILGQRADSATLNNTDEKCIIEGRFTILSTPTLRSFFENNDLDFEIPIVMRREITPTGKSRAFINDTPVQLPLMRELGLMLIDIHSQHSNLELAKRQFQLNVIDWYGNHTELIALYQNVFSAMKKTESQLNTTLEKAKQSKADLDYYEFQFAQLIEMKLVDGEQEILEQELEMLSHAEEIKSGLDHVHTLLDGEEISTLTQLKESISTLQRFSAYFNQAQQLISRLDSQYLEMRDIALECEMLAEKIDHNPSRLEEVSARLDSLYSLEQKHRVNSVGELISLRNDFDAKIQASASFDMELEQLSKQLEKQKTEVGLNATKLHNKRLAVLPAIEKEIVAYLQQLGMPNAQFSIELNQKEDYTPIGNDEAVFLFTANKGTQPEEINKVASGGELSRLMLAIKTVIARSKALPAIVFDEIDTGISGEIASRMGVILHSMSEYMQVINITHLPQIAAKGNAHYLVFKTEKDKNVETGMRLLSNEERVVEIAKMLSNNNPTPEAIANARSLLTSAN
ncbi:MAG TPA: DNA repair protein RecN [Prolixibacteraceae bacterium]|nr:DNA repair protein RecN [Prolixibacteraceae bacterium]